MTSGDPASETKDLADLISAIADLIAAVAWPIIAVLAFMIFRKQIYGSVVKITDKIDGATNIKTPLFEIGFVQTELGIVAEKASPTSGDITDDQIRSSAKIEARALAISPDVLVEEMNSLCTEYERTRDSMPSGGSRTRAMNRIMAQMRALGPSVSGYVNQFKLSDSPGRRLAAIAIMQMVPGESDIPWLLRRFSDEKPFLFYHAAIALKNLSRSSDLRISSQAKSAATKALELIHEFQGPRDQNTIGILQSIADYR